MKLKILTLTSALVLSACAQAMSGIVDMELYWKDCKPYRFPRDLPVITPAVARLDRDARRWCPKRAMVKRAECAAGGSWQVVDLVPAKPEGSSPAVTAPTSVRYDLRDVPLRSVPPSNLPTYRSGPVDPRADGCEVRSRPCWHRVRGTARSPQDVAGAARDVRTPTHSAWATPTTPGGPPGCATCRRAEDTSTGCDSHHTRCPSSSGGTTGRRRHQRGVGVSASPIDPPMAVMADSAAAARTSGDPPVITTGLVRSSGSRWSSLGVGAPSPHAAGSGSRSRSGSLGSSCCASDPGPLDAVPMELTVCRDPHHAGRVH